MVGFIKKNIFQLLFVLVLLIFYSPFILRKEIPVPTDTIVGIYHPFRDFYIKDYPRGYPFKNFLITDPVRQTYVWKELSISILKKGNLPIWNPYEMAGKPLLANFQSGVFYPLNIILFLSPFYFSWSYFIFLQSLLGGFFMFLYLRNLNLDIRAVFLGCISFVFSGFFTSWLEWGTIIQTVIWFPLILYSVDKLTSSISNEKRKIITHSSLLFFSLLSSFFAGHLQSFFYILVSSILYIFLNIYILNKNKSIKFIPIVIVFVLLNVVSSVQWIPTLEFINQSARSIDQNYLTTDGFFMPFSHLIQFIAPDFFGNPTTLNYWGTWNYGELVGYVGLIPLIFAIFAFSKRRKKVYFFALLLFTSLVLATPTFLAKLPYIYELPLISTSQPTRLIFIACFSLSVLAAFGLNSFINEEKKKNILSTLLIVGSMLLTIWFLIIFKDINIFKNTDSIDISFRNLLLPTALYVISALIIFILTFKKSKRIANILIVILLFLAVFDLLRFSSKFNTFSKIEFLYPETKTINYLKSQSGLFRIASIDDRILPPNFATYYRIHSVEGYDPLYLRSYGQFIAALERGSANIKEPYGFNRIITPSNFNSPLFNFLNIKYLLSIEKIESEKLALVFEEGQTKVYENKSVLPRAFFAKRLVFSRNEQDSMEKIFSNNLSSTAIVESQYANEIKSITFSSGDVSITSYQENEVVLETKNNGIGFLVISDSFYPSWHAKIDNEEVPIYKTNHSFRGIVVPTGRHTIKFYTKLF